MIILRRPFLPAAAVSGLSGDGGIWSTAARMGRSALGNPNHAALIATAESAMMLSPDQGVADTINSTIGLLVCGETTHTPYERSKIGRASCRERVCTYV